MRWCFDEVEVEPEEEDKILSAAAWSPKEGEVIHGSKDWWLGGEEDLGGLREVVAEDVRRTLI